MYIYIYMFVTYASMRYIRRTCTLIVVKEVVSLRGGARSINGHGV